MKKSLVFLLTAVMMLSLGSCKTKQSAYKAAYEKAKEKEMPIQSQEIQEVPVVKTPTAQNSGAAVQKEKVTAVNPNDASNLKQYSVVIGSFMNKTNATGLKENMQQEGFNAFLAQNEKGMYRVIVASFSDKPSAAHERDRIKAKYAPRFSDAWLLENQY